MGSEWKKRNRDKVLEQKKRYRERNKEKITQYKKQYRQSNKEKLKEYESTYRFKNAERIKEEKKCYLQSDKYRNANLKRMYGISLEEYNNLLINQNYVCRICKNPQDVNTKNKILYVDHDHSTGRVRGLLCGKCNSGLGFFRDNTTYLAEAIKYLSLS